MELGRHHGHPGPADPLSDTQGLQSVYPDGHVELLTGDDGPFQAPNDLCPRSRRHSVVHRPAQIPTSAPSQSAAWRWSPGGPAEGFVADGFAYCNGIGVTADATVLVVEGRGLMRLTDRSWFVETLPDGGDGFAFDLEGNIYVAGGGAVTVVSPEGKVIDRLTAPSEGASITNCCFGGPDLRTLYATEAHGRLFAFRDMPVAGVAMVPLSL